MKSVIIALLMTPASIYTPVQLQWDPQGQLRAIDQQNMENNRTQALQELRMQRERQFQEQMYQQQMLEMQREQFQRDMNRRQFGR